MKTLLVAFLASWVTLLFGALATSTDSSEPSVFVGLFPYYIISMALLCLLIANWRGDLLQLALISSLYISTVAGLPYLKYPLLYGTVTDNMFHYSLAQTIFNTGHVPVKNAYFGFTTFHSIVAMISEVTGLPVVVSLKLQTLLLPALMSLAGFWIAQDVLRKSSTVKLSILGTIIAFVPNFSAVAPLMAGFLVVLSMAILIQFAKTLQTAPKQSLMISLILVVFALVLTHHQTAFFTIFAFIGIGLLTPIIKGILRTTAIAIPRVELVGLFALGFAYLWWTYYAGFTDLVRNVFSIITGEPLQFQTTVGRGFSYYGPLTWTYRTLINYDQRGQLLLWTGLGMLVSSVILLLRRKWDSVDLDTHAIIFSGILLFLGIYSFFLFVPFFVIGSDRFFRFISFVSPPFIAIGIETTYLLMLRIGGRINFRLTTLLRLPTLRAAGCFLMLALIFVEGTSPLLLGGLYPTSSQYQTSQITFVGTHPTPGAQVVSHLVLTNQFQVYAPSFPVNSPALRDASVNILYSLYSKDQLPSYAHNSLILLQRTGPAGAYFEAINYYPNSTWVSPTLNRLLGAGSTSVLYNGGETFIVYET